MAYRCTIHCRIMSCIMSCITHPPTNVYFYFFPSIPMGMRGYPLGTHLKAKADNTASRSGQKLGADLPRNDQGGTTEHPHWLEAGVDRRDKPLWDLVFPGCPTGWRCSSMLAHGWLRSTALPRRLRVGLCNESVTTGSWFYMIEGIKEMLT